MWKPGTERPERKSKKKADNATTTPAKAGGLAKNKSTPTVKKLSSGTMNMRFMQRTSISPKQLQSPDPDVPMAENSDSGSDHETPRFVTALAEDMYGPVIMGRRSLGGFRPAVEQMRQQSLQAISQQDNRKRKRGKK